MVSITSSEELITARLREGGYKITPQRQAIVSAIASSRCYFTPETLLKKARQMFPALGRVTVYRTLAILDELGLLCDVYPDGTHQGYVLGQVADHHHHIVCSGCGQVTNFSGPDAERLVEQISLKTGFKVEGHILELFGLCPQCRGDNK